MLDGVAGLPIDMSRKKETKTLAWNLTFVFYCIKVRKDFLLIPTYIRNSLQANGVELTGFFTVKALNYKNDSKQIEWEKFL